MPHLVVMPVLKETVKSYSRLNIRISPEIKARVERAARILGQDLTEFTSNTLNQQAQEVIESHDQILLSESDYRYFLEALNKPAGRPSRRSQEALENYNRAISEETRS